MAAIDPKTLETLEFQTIIRLIRGNCLTPYGSEIVAEFQPLEEIDHIRQRLRKIGQLRDILLFGDPFPLGRVEDIRRALEKSGINGARLDPEDFLVVREVISLAAKLRAYRKDKRSDFPELAAKIESLGSFPEIADAIDRTISDDAQVKDSASPELRKIRMSIGETRRRLITKLEQTLLQRKKSQGFQDDVVTQRNDRFVIPVAQSAYRADDGIVMDRSQSGATLFVEPPFAVELNNKLALAVRDEYREVERILIALTAKLGERRDELADTCNVIGHIDSIHAAANFAIKTGSVSPQVVDGAEIELKDARHPLLMYYAEDKKSVIPLDVSLGKQRQGIIITGPNTGGKTVALKTIGLAAVMIRTGLPIPASEFSSVGLFSQVFADIGDEQSIELSLSTFSSHITKVIRAIKRADEKTLLLFDEIGAGTDPAEGAALAEAILLEALQRGAKIIATTHYSRLKTLPLSHPELDNASLEFDRVTLQPTYRLNIGAPGSSYAVEIADRLGMPESVITRARELLGEQERSLAELISSMEDELRQVKADSAELAEKLKSAEELESKYSSQLDELNQQRKSAERQAVEESERLVAETRGEMERLVKEIRENQASQETVKAAHKQLQSLSENLQRRRPKLAPKRDSSLPDEIIPGDHVWIESLKIAGEVAELVGKDRVRVRVGNILNLVNRDDVIKAQLPTGSYRPRRDPSGMREETAPGREIHLRGLTVEEATEKLDKFLDSATLADLSQVYVIHGKGAGILRKSLTEYLKAHPSVKGMRLGDWNEGGAGVTVVQLK